MNNTEDNSLFLSYQQGDTENLTKEVKKRIEKLWSVECFILFGIFLYILIKFVFRKRIHNRVQLKSIAYSYIRMNLVGISLVCLIFSTFKIISLVGNSK